MKRSFDKVTNEKAANSTDTMTDNHSHEHGSHDHKEDHGHGHEHKHGKGDVAGTDDGHSHKGHDHKGHDHKDHDHKDHDHKDHDHKDHDHKGHDHKDHDHKDHDHKDHDHKDHDHKDHDHKDHDHKGHDHKHHDHKDHDHKGHDHKHLEHDHNHVHGEDCDECGSTVAVTSKDDVKDVEVPEWKKKALAMGSDANAAPFGMSWGAEGTVSATEASKKQGGAGHDHDHGHSHEHMDHPGKFDDRPTAVLAEGRDYDERAFTVGLGGPVGSGKTALMLALCKRLRDRISIAAVTNDIFTKEDGDFLTRNQALSADRIIAVETGGCPHAAIREDISANLTACERLSAKLEPLDIILLESGGDNLAANFSPELADYTIYVIDVSGGDKVPRKGGPGVTQSDILVINKTDLADAVGASLDVMKRDGKRMRGDGPIVFAQAKENLGLGVDDVVELILSAWKSATKTNTDGV